MTGKTPTGTTPTGETPSSGDDLDDAGAPPARARHARIWEIVRRVPAGKVATYGQIAAEVPGTTPRMAGYALAALPDEQCEGTDVAPGQAVPWHRIVNARGEISARASGDGDGMDEQRDRLVAEGIAFDARGRIDLRAHRWDPDADED